MTTVFSRTHRPTKSVALVGVAALLSFFVVGLAPTQSAQATQPVNTSATTSIFSSPTWYPFRSEMRISCVYSNCGSASSSHGYWAIDFINPYASIKARVPVYATGGGIAHIGGRHEGCKTATSNTRGNWVWVDHGGGQTSVYYHFSQILVREGQIVTPSTALGTLGSTGDYAPCTNPYLHYEVKEGGLLGTRVEPKQLNTCFGTEFVSYPTAMGRSSFNNFAKLTTIQAGDNATCKGNPARNSAPTAATASVSKTSTAGKISVRWKASAVNPQLTRSQVIAIRQYKPSVKRWGKWEYRYRASWVRGTAFTGLKLRYTYQVAIAAKDPIGYSHWTSKITVKT